MATAHPTGSATVNLRMPGQYFDAESGIFYNWNRYYNPEIGRYISSDPIGLEGGMNTFLYAGANPVMAVDPEGLMTRCFTGSYDMTCPTRGGIFAGGGAASTSAQAKSALQRMLDAALLGHGAGSVLQNTSANDPGNKTCSIESSGNTPNSEDPNNLGPYKDSPNRSPQQFRNIRAGLKQHTDDGSIWSKDRTSHGGEQWKRWDNIKSYERGDRPTSIWADGWIRK